jgi:hypothetical protein
MRMPIGWWSRSAVIANDADHVLSAPELILVARDTLKLEDGAVVAGAGVYSGQAKDLYVGDAFGNGDGALLRVSTGDQVALNRAPASLAGGILDVAAGATVRAGNSAILDATLDNRTLGAVILPAQGGALTLGAARISLLENGTVVNTSGLVFDQDRLAALGNPAELVLRSYSTLDLYGNVSLGDAGLKRLSIEAAGLAGYGAAGQSATLQAETIRIANPDAIAAATAFTGTTGQGDLVVLARDVELGKGDVELRGFDTTTMTATSQVLGQGGSLKVRAGGGGNGNLNLNAGRIMLEAGADQIIEADGALVTGLVPTSAATTPTTAAALGGKLVMIGASLTHAGRIEMPAGIVALKATSGDVTLLSGGEVLAAGASVDFADTRAFAGGGSVSLIAELGDVVTQAGSTIDVGGDSLGGDAGVLSVWAADDAKIAGILLGDVANDSENGFTSGRFELTADHINPDANGDNDFSALNSTLEAGGFRELRRIRLRLGDIELAATDSAQAHELGLSADQGDIRVAGTLDASGGKGGRIELFAGGDLDLLSSARLLAMATDSLDAAKGTVGEGGRVVLGSGDAGVLSLAAGSRINVSVPNGSAARAGRVVLRAARTGAGAGTGVAFGTLAGEIAGAERVDVEAYKVYVGDGSGVTELTTGTSSGNKLGLSSVQSDNNTFVAAVDQVALKGQLDTGAASFHLLPGVEARNAVESDINGDAIVGSGDIVLSSDWNLNPLRHGGQAGVLTVRAGGNLNLAANLSDGFSTATATGSLQTSPTTWSYRLVAGADSAADPLAADRNAAEGNFVLAAGKLVRTGSGDIQVEASGDVMLGNGAALYTAGYATDAVTDFRVLGLTGAALPKFPTSGGDLRLRAGGSVVSEAGPSGLLTDWLYRQGNLYDSSQFRTPGWWPRMGHFTNGVAALGGGDVTIQAGGRVANLLAATVTNARQPAIFDQPVDKTKQVILGGGDLIVRAAGDIEGGLFLVDRGMGRIETGGAVSSGLARATQAVGTVLALGDASASVTARLDLNLESVINPSLVQQVEANFAGAGGSNRESYFVSYSSDSSANLLSITGDTHLSSDRETLHAAYFDKTVIDKSNGLVLYPGSLEAVSLMGDVILKNGFTLVPSASGDLRLLAGNSVLINGTINLSDVALTEVPTLTSTSFSIFEQVVPLALPLHSGIEAHGPELLHQSDDKPVYVVGKTGDIVGPEADISAVLAKAAVFQAGRDIRNVTVYGQNLRDTDVTRFVAGRDLVFDIGRGSTGNLISSNDARIAVAGPGQLQIITGGNIDLGTSQGVVTRGNLTNPYLPEGGADLLALAGAMARDQDGNLLPINPALLDDQVLKSFFAELALSAEESSLNKDYSRGEAAIAVLFPTGTTDAPLTYQGDISLFFSQMKTEQGGNIEMLAPGGGINAGLASVTGFDREAAELGIMTVQGGDIDTYTLGDFQVNSSRVFTISGGDILLWSAEGNIDAGKGAKTASATPPPQLRIDSKGNFVLDVSQSIAGSGIGGLSEGSNVALIAPKGEVNAGDAGIRAGGNLTIAAERVVNSDNAFALGKTTGVPAADAGGLSGSLSGVSNLADNTGEATKSVAGSIKDEGGQSAQEAKQVLAAFKPTFINVEVLGYGDGTASTGDVLNESEKKRRDEEERRRSRQQG